jgi:hypothetical protein
LTTARRLTLAAFAALAALLVASPALAAPPTITSAGHTDRFVYATWAVPPGGSVSQVELSRSTAVDSSGAFLDDECGLAYDFCPSGSLFGSETAWQAGIRLPLGTYYVHVQGHDPSCSPTCSFYEWSAIAVVVIQDTTPPRAVALRSTGKVGNAARLKYRVSDDSGRTRERIKIYRSGRLIKTINTVMSRSVAGTTYYVTWRPKLTGRHRFCVRAWDATGKASAWSCAALIVSTVTTGSGGTSSGGTSSGCHPSYPTLCLNANASDYDCAGGSGDGPLYVSATNFTVLPPDPFGLDGNDNDGVGCES